MMADFGAIVRVARGRARSPSTSRSAAAFVISGGILLVAAVGWVLAPETQGAAAIEPTPARALGPEAGGELP